MARSIHGRGSQPGGAKNGEGRQPSGRAAVEPRAEGNKSGVVQDDPSPWRDAKNSDPS